MTLVDLASKAANVAGKYLREVERPDSADWSRKGRGDFVTGVDRRAEEIIRETLLAGEPGSTVVGEELSPEVVTSGLVWIVDPLDGTTNFLHGLRDHAVSIAAAVDGELVAGVVLEVPANRLYRAWLGGGAWLGERRLKVSSITNPADALIGTGFPYSDFSRMEEYLDQFRRVSTATAGVRRPGSAALDLRSVAEGAFEGFWEQRLSAWDIAAGMLLIREAGGKVTDLTGGDLGIEHGAVVAGNPAIHEWLLTTLNHPS
ncbi:MAG TPA: inositol monophosphatase family protein [Gemmatimonadales bacterium]|jgi:myo-inositol-1(or 4)-monophosphatase|nr:inositol monophosphatase family protein [Gemmatimonadales bacterium]